VQPPGSDFLRSSPQPPATGERGVGEACPHNEEKQRIYNPAPKRRSGALKGEDHGETACDQEENPEKAGKELKYRPCLWLVFLRFSPHMRFIAELYHYHSHRARSRARLIFVSSVTDQSGRAVCQAGPLGRFMPFCLTNDHLKNGISNHERHETHETHEN